LQTVIGGWSREDIAAMMPLTTRQLLVGSGPLLAPILDAKIDRQSVAESNHVTIMGARWIYASENRGAGIALFPGGRI
jgi:hypothetical protein